MKLPPKCPNCGAVNSFESTLELDVYVYWLVDDSGNAIAGEINTLDYGEGDAIVQTLRCISCDHSLDYNQEEIDTQLLNNNPHIIP